MGLIIFFFILCSRHSSEEIFFINLKSRDVQPFSFIRPHLNVTICTVSKHIVTIVHRKKGVEHV